MGDAGVFDTHDNASGAEAALVVSPVSHLRHAGEFGAQS